MTTNEDFEEIYLERLRYLTSIDDMLEQILEDRHSIIHTIRANQKIGRWISQKNDIRVEIGLASA